MKIFFLGFIFFLTPFLSLKAEINWFRALQPFLPQNIYKITIDKTTEREILQIFGPPSLLEKNIYYYEEDGFKYALQVIFKKNIVTEFSYTFFKKSPAITSLKIKKDSLTFSPYPTSGKNAGFFLKHSDKNGILIINTLDKTIYSLRVKK